MCVCECVCVCVYNLFNHRDYRPQGFSVHGISQQEYCNGLPFPFPGDLPDPEIKPESLALQADSLPLSHKRMQIYIYMLSR